MTDLKCGKCGKEYTFEESMKLPKIQAVPEDDCPKEQHGYTSVCVKCGYVFHRDKFRMRDTVEIMVEGQKGKIDISTIFSEYEQGGLWYETMFFNSEGSEVELELNYCERFATKEEAISNHKKQINLLKGDRFQVSPKTYQLTLLTDSGKKEGKNEK